MAKKKPSGFQRRRLSLIRAKLSGIVPFAPPRKRGRPKGETDRHRELRKQIEMDLARLGLPYKQNLYSFLTQKLPDPKWRKEYGLTPPECPYEKIRERHFRREIALAHQKIWGGPKNRSLWQHWRHQKYRLTRAASGEVPPKGIIVFNTGNCRRCVRGGVYVGPCSCFARKIGQQGHQGYRDRKCVICGKAFLSEGIHNRVCAKCNRSPRYV
jgi:hypothetical protein